MAHHDPIAGPAAGGPDPASEGFVDPRFEPVRTAFARTLEDYPGGASLSVLWRGDPVVDLSGGRSLATGAPFTSESLVMTASCTKGMTALCALMLADRGELDLDAPVVRYWPEFGENGKDQTTVRWLLTHRAGLALFAPDEDISAEDLLDWDHVVTRLARQAPLWEPGTRHGYHAVTFGYLVGEVVRRITGQSVGRFLAENVTGPLQADYWIGLPEEQEPRVVPSVAPEAIGAPPPDLPALLRRAGVPLDDPLARAMLAAPRGDSGPTDPVWNTRAFRAAEIPAVNGVGTARALASIHAAMIGQVGNVRLLSPAAMEAARRPQTDAIPLAEAFAALGVTAPRFGTGFQLQAPGMEMMLGPGSFGHTGAGGRLAFAAPEQQLGVGYVCDAMMWDGLTGPDPRWIPVLAALQQVLDA